MTAIDSQLARADLGSISYLDRYPLLQTADREFARERLFKAYGADRFGAQDHAFGVRANFANLNSLGLAFCAYDGSSSLSFPESGIVRQLFSIQGTASFKTGRADQPITAWTPIIPGDSRLDLEFAGGYRQLVLRADAAALERLLKSILGDDSDKRLSFVADDPDPVAMPLVRRDVFQLAEELDKFGTNYSPVAIAELERAVMVRLLLGHRHNFSDQLHSAPPRANRSVIDLVESYIESHWDEPINLENLARIANVSVRTIFREFSVSGRGSPGQFVKRLRLQQAEQLLSRPDEETSVIAVAFKCGFANVGRFAAQYRQAVGELPSETLRNARRRRISAPT